MTFTIRQKQYEINQPPVMAVCAFIFAIALMIVSSFIRLSGIITINPGFPWNISAVALLVYAIASSGYTVFTDTPWQHAQYALFSFLVLFIACGLLAYGFSGISIFEAESGKIVYTILLIAEFLLLGIGIFIKRIYIFLSEEEEAELNKREQSKQRK